MRMWEEERETKDEEAEREDLYSTTSLLQLETTQQLMDSYWKGFTISIVNNHTVYKTLE